MPRRKGRAYPARKGKGMNDQAEVPALADERETDAERHMKRFHKLLAEANIELTEEWDSVFALYSEAAVDQAEGRELD